MKFVKFEKEVVLDNFERNENKVVDFIESLIDSGLGGDWSDHYKEGDIIKYNFELDEDYIEDLNDDGIDVNDIKEFIGNGVCLIDKLSSECFKKDICYNVEFIENNIIVKYEYFDLE